MDCRLSLWDMNIRLGDASKGLERANLDKIMLSLRALEYSGAALACSCDAGDPSIRSARPAMDNVQNAERVRVFNSSITDWTDVTGNEWPSCLPLAYPCSLVFRPHRD